MSEAGAGAVFESELREQPAVWRRVADSHSAQALADALRGRDVVLVGSGSSLFAAQLGALALRRRGVRAAALAATEAAFDARAYSHVATVALSQSGRSTDVLAALDVLEPAVTIALTNSVDSPLGARADIALDIGAGRERAVPASKSVTATVAILLWAAGLLGTGSTRDANALRAAADDVERWLRSGATANVEAAARVLCAEASIVIVGAGYGVPIASELALKMKEASYVHAEGFPAGEFRHGSSAILDRSHALLGIVDEASRGVVERPLLEAGKAGALRYTIGADVDHIERLGPVVAEPFNTLAWLVTGQLLALYAGRARGIDSDAPRGLSKFML